MSLPTKSKILRTLRKVYPNARFAREGTIFFLCYRPPGERSEVDICSLQTSGWDGPPDESIVRMVLTCAAFEPLGFTAKWEPRAGAFQFTAIEGYVGPEQTIPIELAPDTDNESADRMIAAGVAGLVARAAK